MACGATDALRCVCCAAQAASDVYSPVSGTVVETNGALADAPATARSRAAQLLCREWSAESRP